MADRRGRCHVLYLEYTFDRLLATKLERVYAILVPDHSQLVQKSNWRFRPEAEVPSMRKRTPMNYLNAAVATGPAVCGVDSAELFLSGDRAI